MTWRFAFFFLLIVSIVVNCSDATRNLAGGQTRMLEPGAITSFHPEISITLGWMPYENQKLVQTGKDEWKIVKHQSNDGAGKVPVILVSYPDSKDSILLDMNIENELLGKLIKHSAITQEPIKRPFVNFFEDAKCQKCHPPHIKVDFDN